MKKTVLLALVMMVWMAGAVWATPNVIFTVNGTTGMSQQTGQLVAGSTATMIFRLSDGAWLESGVYSLTVKADGSYTATPFALVTGDDFEVSGADLQVDVDLNVDELFEYLGTRDARSVMFELADATSSYVVSHRVIVVNSVRRAGDSAPANPAENTYTDDEIDAAIAAIPAGVTPVQDPIDGWSVQSTDTGQIELGPIAMVNALQKITEYPETTTLATTDLLLVWDASESALRKVTLNTLLTWLQAQLGL